MTMDDATATEHPTITTHPGLPDEVLIHIPEFTYWDTQAWSADLGIPADVLPALRNAIETHLTGVQPPIPDTLPAWLYQRFAPAANTRGWDELDDTDQSYWVHHAAAVRRAVARGGFKEAA
jgi:hypothetical protein